MRRPRRSSCRYGSLGLIGCLVAIAAPDVAFAETCSISASPPGPVQPGAIVDVSAGCTGAWTLIQWSSCLANCYPAFGPSTTCYFYNVGQTALTVEATYAGSFGGCFSASDTYPIEVSWAAPPSCHIYADPVGPVQPGAFVNVYSGCTDGPTTIQWSSSLADCAPSTGWSTVCHFPTVGSAVLAVEASYSGSFGGSFGGSFAAFDSYPMEVSNLAPPSCHITTSTPGPVQPGASVDAFADCTGNPTLISWYSSSLADCAPTIGPSTSCNFPTASNNEWVSVQAYYDGSFGAGYQAYDYYSMQVNSAARPSCHISAVPAGLVQPGQSAELFAGCTDSPTLIQWDSTLADCSPLTGPSTVCDFPTVGTAVLAVEASYTGSFGGSFGGSFAFAAFDSYPMEVSNFVPSCQISAIPPGPVQPGAYAELFADCTGSPMIAWSSSLASCNPSTGPSTECYFWTAGTAVVEVEASYAGSLGGWFLASDSYSIEVSYAAPPSCQITAYPPGPVQPGAFVDVYAGCTDGPTKIEWSSSLADCAPSTGYSTVCHFPTVGSAVLAVQASYSGSFGGSFGGSFMAFDSYPMEVSSVAPPTCRVTATPSGSVQAGESATLSATCTGSPTLIQWSSSLADCVPLTGPSTVCNFPTAGWAYVSVEASYAGSLGGGFSVYAGYQPYVYPSVFTVTNTNDNGEGSLRTVIDQAVAAGPASTVEFAPDVTGTITLTSGQIRIYGPLSIVGPGADILTIDANANSRIFSIYRIDPACPALDGPDYVVSISGLRLTNARRTSSNNAGAIFTEHSLALDSMIVDNNTAGNGGGVTFQIQYPGQSFTITNSRFLDNIAQPLTANPTNNWGGAVAFYEKCAGTRTTPVTLTIADSLFSGNRAQPVGLSAYGGAINAYSHADITITDTRIVDNHIDIPVPPVAGRSYRGGGIYVKAKSLTIARSEISGNSADVGGGLALESLDLDLQAPETAMATIIVNSTISGNIVAATAGAAFVYGNVAVELDNTTISDNTAAATRTGGILFNTGATVPASAGKSLAGTLKLVSSILANSHTATSDLTAPLSGGIPSFSVVATNSLIETMCFSPGCEITVTGPGNLVGIDPLLGPLADHGGMTRTHALLAGSPAIDTGSNPLALTTDQRGGGFPRVLGAAADMGAHEAIVATPPALQSAVSRRVHSTAGTFNLPLGSVPTNPTTEPRQGPAFTMVFTFDKPVTAGTATVTVGTATVGAVTFSGNEMRVPLTNVADQQYVTVTVSNVASSDGGTGGGGSVRVGFLKGDANQNRVVTFSDDLQVNNVLGQPVTSSNYLKDLNANGILTFSDNLIVNNQGGRVLPAP